MASIIKVNDIQNTSGANIINESSNTITIGASGDTVSVPSGATFDVSNATVNGIQAGITEADQWRLTTTFGGDAEPISSNLERVDGTGQGTLGTGMTESSGIFTFPSTGIYFVSFTGSTFGDGTDDTQVNFAIQITTNNSTYNERAVGLQRVKNGHQQTWYTDTYVDVTDTSQVKVRFDVYATDSANIKTQGNSNYNITHMTFIRLGDT